MFEHLPEWVGVAGEWIGAAILGITGIMIIVLGAVGVVSMIRYAIEVIRGD